MKGEKSALPGQVLLACYNGAAHLPAQLDSIAGQTTHDWRLLAGDDGSRDDSRALLAAFAATRPAGQVTVCDGPQAGFVAHFMALLAASDGPWVALCDQDDVWHPERLARARAWLQTQPADRPALYCSRAWVCGPDLARRHMSPPAPRGAGFANALVENIATGHTIVLNAAARDLLVRTGGAAGHVFAHDWWMYLVVSGCGGAVYLDPQPGVFYRQHRGNTIGYGRKWHHIPQILQGAFRDRIGRNIAALETIQHELTPRNRALLTEFSALRQTRSAVARMRGIGRLGLYRQTLRGQAGLVAATGLACV